MSKILWYPLGIRLAQCTTGEIACIVKLFYCQGELYTYYNVSDCMDEQNLI